MKKFVGKFMILVAVIICCPSCSDDDFSGSSGTGEITGITEDIYVEADTPIDSVGWIEHYELLAQEISGSNDEDGQVHLDAVQNELNAAKKYVDSLYRASGMNAGEDGGSGKNSAIGYKYTTIRYKSIDENNNPIMFSALVVWPYNSILGKLGAIGRPDADGVVIGCHITITNDVARPTNYSKRSVKTDVGMLACAAKSRGLGGGWGAAFENLVVIPDYQGYGATRDRIHPYLQQDLTARQVIDGVNAGIHYYTEVLNHNFEDDWNSIAMGYSQGGSVALAVHRYIEKNDLIDSLRFVGSLCGDGPYDPMATVKQYVKKNQINMPVAMGLILKGMLDANPYIKGKYSATDFFTQKFVDTAILDTIANKNKSTKSIQKFLFNYSAKYNESEGKFVMYRKSSGKFLPHTKDNLNNDAGKKRDWKDDGYAKTTDILRPEVISFIKGDTIDPKYEEKMEDFSKAMDMNNLTSEDAFWVPKKAIVLFHSLKDDVVPIENYYSVMNAFSMVGGPLMGYVYTGNSLYDHIKFGKVFYVRFSDIASTRLFNEGYNNILTEEKRLDGWSVIGGL